MRTLVALLSVLLVSLPCAGSLPVLCGDHHTPADEAPSCCQRQARTCNPGQTSTFCCTDQTVPTPLPLSQVSMPTPAPAPELPVLAVPTPVFALRLSSFHPAAPPGASRPALYLLHQAYRI